MNRPEQKKLYKQAWKRWGHLQYAILMEECAELIKAVSKYQRNGNSSAQLARDLVEEIADVEIMIEQLIVNHDWENFRKRIEKAKHDKLLRLKDILERDR